MTATYRRPWRRRAPEMGDHLGTSVLDCPACLTAVTDGDIPRRAKRLGDTIHLQRAPRDGHPTRAAASA